MYYRDIIRSPETGSVDKCQSEKRLKHANRLIWMEYTTLISTGQLAGLMSNETAPVIVDCRFDLMNPDAGEHAWREGHLPGAFYAHLDHDLAAPVTASTGRHPLPDVNDLVEKLRDWGIGKDTQVVVYDDSAGGFAVRLWWMLRWLGHTRVAVLNGGWSKWMAEDRDVDTGSPSCERSRFSAEADDSQWLSRQAVAAALDNQSILLVDARTEERFKGIEEPIDPVAGHIPGAVNYPFQQNLDEHGCFLSSEQLKERYSRFLGSVEPGSVVHMCGSGVTAIHNLIAMEHAGLRGSKLYVGSWSEWIRYQ